MIQDNHFVESFCDNNISTHFKIKKILLQEQSPWQKIEVVETETVGKMLILDGKTMISEHDEFIYHEVMSHIPYMASPKTRKVLIIGGGDGGMVREFVKHPEIDQIDLVEIDQRVIDVSKEFFPQCASGLDDPRVSIITKDGIEFVSQQKNKYDIIVIDSTDPVDFAKGLFTDKFYKAVYNALTDHGIMTAQTENIFYDEYGIKDIYDNLRRAFPVVQSFWGPIAIYPGVFWTYAFASKGIKGTDIIPEKREHMKNVEKTCKWYNLEWHETAFKLSNLHKKNDR